MENSVRIFRENPIAWWDKPVMRYLRRKYGGNKRLFVALRGVYLALCEIESDFTEEPISFFTQTVGTYAGVTREVAGRCINLLENEGLLYKTRIKDEKTKRFSTGTIIILKSLQRDAAVSEPLPRIASIGDRQQRGSWASIKNITNVKKINIPKNNVSQETGKNEDRIEYFARLLADKLHDQKSVAYYRRLCLQSDPHMLLRKAHEIIADGKAKKPAAVFVAWFKDQNTKHREPLQLRSEQIH
jgi:hypothetical protein